MLSDANSFQAIGAAVVYMPQLDNRTRQDLVSSDDTDNLSTDFSSMVESEGCSYADTVSQTHSLLLPDLNFHTTVCKIFAMISSKKYCRITFDFCFCYDHTDIREGKLPITPRNHWVFLLTTNNIHVYQQHQTVLQSTYAVTHDEMIYIFAYLEHVLKAHFLRLSIQMFQH